MAASFRIPFHAPRFCVQIMAQIKRRFPDHPPCRCMSGINRRASGIEHAGEAAEAMGKVLGALIG